MKTGAKPIRHFFSFGLLALTVTACGGTPYGGIESKGPGVSPAYSFPVTTNNTPYSRCLAELSKLPGNHLPVLAVGEIADKTGQINYDENGHVLTQGVSEMVMSAFYKTGKTNLVERYDLRIPLAEVKMARERLSTGQAQQYRIHPADFLVVGALTEVNYNIVSDGAGLWIAGIGGGGRTVVMNVGLDLRVVDTRNFAVRHVSSLQKQIYGFEVEANIFRFFGTQLVELDTGRIQNEPIQLGVRSVVEMASYQVMTKFFGLPEVSGCSLVDDDMGSRLAGS